jgi:hypothetical protein
MIKILFSNVVVNAKHIFSAFSLSASFLTSRTRVSLCFFLSYLSWYSYKYTRISRNIVEATPFQYHEFNMEPTSLVFGYPKHLKPGITSKPPSTISDNSGGT